VYPYSISRSKSSSPDRAGAAKRIQFRLSNSDPRRYKRVKTRRTSKSAVMESSLESSDFSSLGKSDKLAEVIEWVISEGKRNKKKEGKVLETVSSIVSSIADITRR